MRFSRLNSYVTEESKLNSLLDQLGADLGFRFSRLDSKKTREIKLNRLEQAVSSGTGGGTTVLHDYTVGELFITEDPSDPSVQLGYGSWTLIGTGTVYH